MKLPFVEKEKSDEKIIRPENWGWIEKKLDHSSIDYLWRCIDKKGEKIKDNLIFAHVDEVYLLLDRGDWFFHHVVEPLALDYEREFGNGLSTSIPVATGHRWQLGRFWVNYYRSSTYIPLHDHTGIYSFVIWLKIPSRQKILGKSHYNETHYNSTFQFYYIDLLGAVRSHTYYLNPEDEGTMVLFPSTLKHCVHPHYSDEDRITISGNIILNSSTHQKLF